MRHLNAGRKLGRNSEHRQALYRNLTTDILRHGRVRTTLHKAKEARRFVEQMITLGKRGHLHARRQAAAFLRDNEVVKKVFGDYAQVFKDRAGGYTRILKLGPRPGDCAEMAFIELVDGVAAPEKPAAKEKGKGKAPAKAKGKEKPAKASGAAEKPKQEKPARGTKKSTAAEAAGK